MKRMVLGITEKCNTQCTYCYIAKTKKQNQMNKKIAEQAIAFFLRQINNDPRMEKQLIITGGEPLMAYNLIKFLVLKYIRILNKKNIVIGVPTNGLLLNREKIEFFKRNNILLSLSYDGLVSNSRRYKSLRTKHQLNLFKDFRNYIRIRLTISPEESGFLLENFYYLYRLKFRKFDIQPTTGFFWYEKQKKQYLIDLEKIIKIIIKDKTTNLKIIDPKNDFKSKCPAIIDEIFINSDGNIYPCQIFMALPIGKRNKFLLGNILDVKKYNTRHIFYKICEPNQFIENKDKCPTCQESTACSKFCLALNLKTREFDPKLAVNFWNFEKEIEKLLLKYGKTKSLL